MFVTMFYGLYEEMNIFFTVAQLGMNLALYISFLETEAFEEMVCEEEF